MELDPKEVRQLLNRASARWDELKPLLMKKTPLTEDQVSEEVAEHGEVCAVVKMDFEEIMGQLEFVEPVLDDMAERMAGEVALEQLDYKVLFNHGDTLYLKVTAKVESEDGEEEVEDDDEESN